MGYPALQSGYAMSPRGVAAFFTTFFVGRLVGKIRSRWLLAFGFVMLAYSSFILANINLQMGMVNIIWPSILNGIAISFIFVPLTTSTMSQLGQAQIGNASGLYNLMRNPGGSIGIAFVTTMLCARRANPSGPHGRPSHPHRPRLRRAFCRRQKSAVAPH